MINLKIARTLLPRQVLISLIAVSFCMNSHASYLDSNAIGFGLKHGAQGTGNYKGKRDRHEKPMPQNEKKKKSSKWLPLKKK